MYNKSVKFLENFEDRFDKASKNMVEMQETFLLLDKTEKSLLAQIASECEGSETKRMRLARTDDRYKEHIKALAWASSQKIKATLEVDKLRRLHDQSRTFISQEKAKMKMV